MGRALREAPLLIGAFCALLLISGTASAAPLEAEVTRVAPAAAAVGASSRLIIEGRAAGEEFSSAVLDAGQGELPTEWRRIATLSAPVANGVLGQWETLTLPADRYTIRLTVYSRAGLLRQTQQVVNLKEWRPDLVIRQALRRLDNGTLTVAVELANQGRQPAAGPIGLTIMGQKEASPPVRLARWELSGTLPPGAQSSKTGAVALPAGMSAGRYTLTVLLDEEVKIADADRSNNRALIEPAVELGPDLAITQLKYEMAADGRSIKITDRVINQGLLATTLPSTVLYYLSPPGSSSDASDIFLGQRALPPIGVGGQSSVATVLALPPDATTGFYFLRERISPSDAARVQDANPDNNDYLGGGLKIGPQLVIEAVKAELAPQGAMAVTVTVKNQGTGAMKGPQPVLFAVARDEAGKERVVELGRQSLTPIAAGGRAAPAFTLSLPSTLAPGAYFVTVQLDGLPAEQNISSAALSVGPDLATQALKAELVGQGEQTKVSITDTIVNKGTRASGKPFRVTYLLSTDWRLDGQDLVVGHRTIEQLPAGEQHNATVQFSVPVQTIETGRYFVLSRIDLEGAIEESNPGNNLRPTVEGLLIERLEKERKPDMPDVISEQVPKTSLATP